ncbi:hypothetical protein P3S67_007939 [Capsicum chacoense]
MKMEARLSYRLSQHSRLSPGISQRLIHYQGFDAEKLKLSCTYQNQMCDQVCWSQVLPRFFLDLSEFS